MRTLARLSALLLGAFLAQPLVAQPIKIAGLVELSGTGATSGSNFNDGVKLAGRQVETLNGRKFSEVKSFTYRFTNAVDEKAFAKP